MDISRPIVYRTVDLNSVSLETGRVLRGIAVESVDYSSVQAVGYTEKRAGADGFHASDVYLGGREVELAGHIYAPNLAELHSFLHVLRATMSPTSQYQESPGDRGFLPMYFSQPTPDEESFPGGVIDLKMYLRCRENLRFSIARDRMDSSKRSNGARPTAIPWAARLWAKDPRVYVHPEQEVSLVGGPFSLTSDEAINRGDYETPLNIQLVIGAAPGSVKNFKVLGLNGIDMTISIENKANVVYRWFGDDRVLMTQDITGGIYTRPFILRMDLVTFATANRRPSVPADIDPPARPFSTAFQYSSTAVFDTGSRLFWSEAFA